MDAFNARPVGFASGSSLCRADWQLATSRPAPDGWAKMGDGHARAQRGGENRRSGVWPWQSEGPEGEYSIGESCWLEVSRKMLKALTRLEPARPGLGIFFFSFQRKPLNIRLAFYLFSFSQLC